MFELATPWALVALVFPLIIWWAWPQAKPQYRAALRVPFFHDILGHLKPTPSDSFPRLLFAIWVLLVVALSGPRWVGQPLNPTQHGHQIMLALDISGSMALDDRLLNGRRATRLSVVKHTARQFVRHLDNDKIGLILFGTQAYLQTPLTLDHPNVLARIQDASIGLAGQTTSIGDAIGLAVKRMKNVSSKGRVLILLTDGANNSGILTPLKAANIAASHHIKIYTIGLGRTETLALRHNTSDDLDEDTLKAIAKITHGHYFKATDVDSLVRIYNTIGQLEHVTFSGLKLRPQKDYYIWPLMGALGLMAIWLITSGNLSFNKKGNR